MTVEEKDIQSLLSQVGSIKQKYDQIAEITGEKFNVFSILGLQDREVRLHSAFISELLNPKGSHGQKDLFLKLFINHLNTIDYNCKINKENYLENELTLNFSFKCETAILHKEKRVNFGQIDILITNNSKQCIVIENKIWAEDQDEQLIRYNKYLKTYIDYKENTKLFYLAPHNGKPDEISIKDKLKENEDYFCLDYKDDIIPWLDACKKEAVSLPIVRETICQYINIIKSYYGELNINYMGNSITETIIEKKENIETAFTIASLINDVKKELMKKLKDQLILLIESKNFQFNIDDGFFDGYKDSIIYIHNENWKKHNICIGFAFDQHNFNSLYYGIKRYDDKATIELDILNKIPQGKSTEWWPYWEYSGENWQSPEPWCMILDKRLIKQFEENIYDLSKKIEIVISEYK